MLLLKATVAGYRSLKDPVEFHLDPNVTVVLGANDHGKSNLLQALRHLNANVPFKADVDLNWDCRDDAAFPSVTYHLQLSEDEQALLRERERMVRQRHLLVEYCDAAASAVTSAEEVAASRDAGLSAAEEEVLRARTAFEVAEVASDDRPDEPGPVAQLKIARDELANADSAYAAALASAESAHDDVHELSRRGLVAAAALLIVRRSAEGVEPNDAFAREAEALAEQKSAADRNVAKADERLEEAVEALEAGKTTHPEGSEEYVRLDKAVSTARTAKKRADREVVTLAERRNRLESQREAWERHSAQEDGWYVADLPSAEALPVTKCPSTVSLTRAGVDGKLRIDEIAFPAEVLDEFVLPRIPRVSWVSPTEKIPDSVNRKSLETDTAVFMRGIFHYAGITPDEWDGIFTQTDVTTRRLDDASDQLNQRLRDSWSQGSRLSFLLKHDSANKRIDLLIKDPAVTQQFVRASKRSSGFTHFFALKTILNAYQHEAPASSYIWVFDEPGVYLHPDGQHDLVQVMETISRHNQVVYSTHSIFMANKNYPTRHRLVLKTAHGSKLDGKPFRSRWQPAIEALGMSLPGTLLFASRVLLVEGDSDSILLNAMLQKLIETGQFERDVNTLAVMSAGDPPDAAALVRILKESHTAPDVAALFDGDEGGRKRERALQQLDRSDLEIKCLAPQDTTTEDHLPAALELYPRALATYLAKMAPRRDDEGQPLAEARYLELILARLPELEQSAEGLTKGMANWARAVGKEIGELEDTPSPVGIAREYALILQATDAAELRGQTLRRPREIAKWIARTLDLPEMTLREDAILATEELPDDLV